MSDHDNELQKVVYAYDMNTIGLKVHHIPQIKMSNYKESDIPLHVERSTKIAWYIAHLKCKEAKPNISEKDFIEYITSVHGIELYNEIMQKALSIIDPELTREKLALFLKQNRTT